MRRIFLASLHILPSAPFHSLVPYIRYSLSFQRTSNKSPESVMKATISQSERESISNPIVLVDISPPKNVSSAAFNKIDSQHINMHSSTSADIHTHNHVQIILVGSACHDIVCSSECRRYFISLLSIEKLPFW